MNPEIVNYDPSGWILGDLVFVPVVVEPGQKLKQGSVLGLVESTQMAKLCDSASQDGSEIPRFVLLYDIDTTETGLNGDGLTRVIQGGKLREDRLVFGGGTKIDSKVKGQTVKEHLRGFNILTYPNTYDFHAYDNQ